MGRLISGRPASVMSNPIVISYYTKNTPYEEEVRGLVSSLKKFGLEHDIVPVDPQGTWQKNTRIKAGFIGKMIRKHRGKSLLWMDADSVMVNKPALIGLIDTDAAFYFRTTGGRVPRIREDCELISASMFFRANERTLLLTEMWIEANRRNERDLEQHNLQGILPEWRRMGGTLSLLPQAYCKIFDSDQDHNVIIQNQASRRFQALVGG